MATFSVIIPLWNGMNFIADCLDAVMAQRLGRGNQCEIIVVDNASSDGSAELVRHNYRQVQLIRNHFNLGFGGGCNRGILAAQGDVIFLLNQDTQLEAGCIQAIEQTLQRPSIGIVGCKSYYPDGKTLQHAGGWVQWPQGDGHHYGYRELDAGQCDEARQVEWVTGAALAMRRSVIDKVGLLDEAFWPGYFEDVDYCLRANQAGFETWYAPSASLQHQESQSARNEFELRWLHQRGRLRLTLKHLPPQRWLNEFVPAERQLLAGCDPATQVAFQINYLEMAATVDALLLKQGMMERPIIRQISAALQELADSVNTSVPMAISNSESGLGYQPLTDFEFQSTSPVVGSLITRFRRLWYNVAARWPIDQLRRQQHNINLEQAQFNRQINQQIEALHKHYQHEMTLLRQQVTQQSLRNGQLTQLVLELQRQLEVSTQ